MPKPLELSADIMTPPPVPKAAQAVPVPVAVQPAGVTAIAATPERPAKIIKPIEIKVPFQVRWPKNDVKAAKLAALNLDFPSESEFMLACFHAYMQSRGSKK